MTCRSLRILDSGFDPFPQALDRLCEKGGHPARWVKNQPGLGTAFWVAKDVQAVVLKGIQPDCNHEANDLRRSEVLAEFLLVDERVGQEFAEDFVEDVEAGKIESISLAVKRFEAVHQLLGKLFLLSFELQLEILGVHFVS